MIDLLDIWVKDHYEFFIGSVTFVALTALMIMSIFQKKIGGEGERAYNTKLKIAYSMYITLLLVLTAFILVMPSNAMFYRQYLVICIVLSIIVGAIYTVKLYLNHQKK
ncbi:hypothetical protein [Cytobacillus sp. IB215665]|uniref:hypothetical protein n=1 Tax=Cytobacillus sp. IB215665 TaxID=3097357 RepID=UPI002A0CFB04|nr:hypothetical protein [Cytobacillus sp. IB215665]MDX8365356.1 hypothetical protein [Cytobacillus sp. IB215665]